jgi:Arc/MetJ-type ribon-helix-helix transcriptional regulator
MTIHLPKDIESSIEAAVHRGEFASVDDAMTEAARLLLCQIGRGPQPASAGADAAPDPLLGVWRECAEEMDEIVANAMRQRREEPWRAIPGE